MDNTNFQSVLFAKAKHLTKKDADRLFTLGEKATERQIMRLSSVSTTNPLLLTLLFWFLPPFFLFNNFFVRNYLLGLIQLFLLVMAFGFFAASATNHDINLMSNGAMEFSQSKADHANTLNTLAAGTSMFIAMWYFIDGLTMYWRTKSSNFRKLRKALK